MAGGISASWPGARKTSALRSATTRPHDAISSAPSSRAKRHHPDPAPPRTEPPRSTRHGEPASRREPIACDAPPPPPSLRTERGNPESPAARTGLRRDPGASRKGHLPDRHRERSASIRLPSHDAPDRVAKPRTDRRAVDRIDSSSAPHPRPIAETQPPRSPSRARRSDPSSAASSNQRRAASPGVSQNGDLPERRRERSEAIHRQTRRTRPHRHKRRAIGASQQCNRPGRHCERSEAIHSHARCTGPAFCPARRQRIRRIHPVSGKA